MKKLFFCILFLFIYSHSFSQNKVLIKSNDLTSSLVVEIDSVLKENNGIEMFRTDYRQQLIYLIYNENITSINQIETSLHTLGLNHFCFVYWEENEKFPIERLNQICN